MIRPALLFICIASLVSGCNIGASSGGDEVVLETPPASSSPVETESALEGEVLEESSSEPVVSPFVNDGSWVVVASTQEKEFAAPLAVDGDFSTRWSSEFNDNQWWMVDFGAEKQIEKIRILWEDGHAASYRVLLSRNGTEWDVALDEDKGRPGSKDIRFDVRPVRYVKIECRARATAWGFSFFEVEFNTPDATGSEASSSSGTGDYAAHFAIDGDKSTRWSSDFSDSEWWQVQFKQPRTLTGMKIFWETAFTEKYEIMASDDGQDWRTIYTVPEGDGQTDILFFKPVTTTYLRVNCRQRGTGWGNSIYEVSFFDESNPATATASATAPGSSPLNGIDGDTETAWKSGADGEQSWVLTFPEVMAIGGAELTWGENYATSYVIEWSTDGEQWIGVFDEARGNGGKDYDFFPELKTWHLRIVCRESNARQGYDLARVELKSGEERSTPLREYQAKAKGAPRGRFPMWLTRQQEFWTVVGVPDDSQEMLMGETGTIEPYKGGFSVQPFLLQDEAVFTWADVDLEQRLEQEYIPMPSVTWKAQGWQLDISAVVAGAPGETCGAVRYRITNNDRAARSYKLVLAVRPVQLNPVWQHGGMSPIHEATCLPAATPPRVKINGADAVVSLSAPASMGATVLTAGDVSEHLGEEGAPANAETASDPDGRVSVRLSYPVDLQPGESKDIVIAFPLHKESNPSAKFAGDPAAAFAGVWDAEVAKWTEWLDKLEIDIPEPRLVQTMKSNLGYVLINRDAPWFKPGSRNYNHSWMRDGALTGYAMLRLGKPDLVRDFIANFSEFVDHNGWVPFMIMEDGKPCGFNSNPASGEGQEYDSQGEFVFIVRQYYDFTGDEALVREVYPKVVKALEFGREIRKRRLTDQYKGTVFYGILPESNSHEGYYPAKHSYWDDFWMLRGLKDGQHLATRLGMPADAAWMKAEETDLRRCFTNSLMAVIRRDKLKNIPGCAELGDEDPTSTSVAIMACDEASHVPQPFLDQTFERYQERISKRYRGEKDTFTPYEARNADVFVRLGQRQRALQLLRYFVDDSMRPHNWNHMAEVVHATARAPSYIGDMPHTWVGSDYINAVRSLFSFSEGGRLVLAGGVDPKWLDAGVRVKNLPTEFGMVDYAMTKRDGGISFVASGSANPPDGFVLPLPEELVGMRAEIDGKPATVKDGKVLFQSLPVVIRLAE